MGRRVQKVGEHDKGTAVYLYRLTLESERYIEALGLILDKVSDSVDRVPSALEKMLPNIYMRR
jgi:hypothetical protein